MTYCMHKNGEQRIMMDDGMVISIKLRRDGPTEVKVLAEAIPDVARRMDAEICGIPAGVQVGGGFSQSDITNLRAELDRVQRRLGPRG